jgi:hypothetical protein
MRQICNLAYRTLTDGMSTVQIAELNAELAGPEEKEEMIGRQNVEAMKQLAGFGVGPPPAPPGRADA